MAGGDGICKTVRRNQKTVVVAEAQRLDTGHLLKLLGALTSPLFWKG